MNKPKTRNYSKYSKLAIFMSKCLPMLLRMHIVTFLQSIKMSLDEFLNKNMNEIYTNCKLLPHQKRILFPGFAEKTIFEDWDLVLLTVIIKKVCKPSPQLRNDIDHMKRMRDKLFHGNPDKFDDKYTRNLDKAKQIIQRGLAEINDQAFTDEMDTLVKDVESGELIMDDPFQGIKEWFNTELSQGRLQGLEYQELMKKIDEFFEKQSSGDQRGIVIPDTEVVLVVQNCNIEREAVISRMLLGIADPKLQQEFPNLSKEDLGTLRTIFDNSMRELLSGGRLPVSKEEGCVIIRIRCPSLKSLNELWMKCVTGEVTSYFKPVQCFIRQLKGCEHVDITAVVAESEVLRCLNIVVLDILKEGHPHSQNGESSELMETSLKPIAKASIIERDDEHAGSLIKINIQPKTLNQLGQIFQSCISGELDRNLEKCSKRVQDILNINNLTIKAMFDEEQMSKSFKDAEVQLQLQEKDGLVNDVNLSGGSNPYDVITKLQNENTEVITGVEEPSDDDVSIADETEDELAVDTSKPSVSTSDTECPGFEVLVSDIEDDSSNLKIVAQEESNTDYGSLQSGTVNERQNLKDSGEVDDVNMSGNDTLEADNESDFHDNNCKDKKETELAVADKAIEPDSVEPQSEHIMDICDGEPDRCDNEEKMEEKQLEKEDLIQDFVSVYKEKDNNVAHIASDDSPSEKPNLGETEAQDDDNVQVDNEGDMLCDTDTPVLGTEMDEGEDLSHINDVDVDEMIKAEVLSGNVETEKAAALSRFGTADVRVIESYIKALNEGKEKSTSLRLNIVGHFGAGKTTVTRKLIGLPLDGIQSTNGIDINVHKCLVSEDGEWTKQNVENLEKENIRRLLSMTSDKEQSAQYADNTLDVNSSLLRTTENELIRFIEIRERERQPQLNDKTKTVNIWDFGGQWIFYATHQLFHSPDAIYLLVLDVSKKLDDMVVDEDFPGESSQKDVKSFCKFWMNSINSFVGKHEKPPVILIGTHMDMVIGKKRDEIEFKYFDAVRELFNETSVLRRIQSQDFLIDSTTTDDQLNKLRDYIVSVADKGATYVPAKWIRLENSLMRKIAAKHITFEEVAEIGKVYQINKTEDIVAFLTYQNAQGTFFYFNEPVLDTCVVLKPQWIVDAFKCIITSERFCKNRHSLRQPWDELMKKAILRPALIEQVWQNDGENDFIKHRDILIQYMTKFGIVAKAKRYDENTETCQALDYFFVPSLLRHHCTTEDYQAFNKGRQSTTMSLVFSFENAFVSTTLYHRTTAAALEMWAALHDGTRYMLFEDVGMYRLDHNHAGIINVTDRTVEIKVVSMLGEANDIDCKQSDKLRRFVEMVLKDEFGRFGSKEEQYTIQFRCSFEDKSNQCVIKKDAMEHETKIACPNLAHSHGDIDVQHVMRQWYPHKSSIGCYNITRLRETITEKDLNRIACNIGKNWELLASSLDISQTTCDHIKLDNPLSSVLQIFKMLVNWRQENGGEATYEVLLRAMESNPSVTIDWDRMKNILDNFKV